MEIIANLTIGFLAGFVVHAVYFPPPPADIRIFLSTELLNKWVKRLKEGEPPA